MTEVIEKTEYKKGYKKTKLGWIPEDWKILQLKDICPLQRGFDLPSSEVVLGKYPIVYSNGIQAYHKEFKVKAPGVITGRSGTIGKVHFIEKDFWPHNTTLWVTDFKNNNPKYIYYLLISLNLGLYHAGSGVPTLNRNDIHIKYHQIPPIQEQEKIVEILSAWDDGIETLEKLIEQKEILKNSLAQKCFRRKNILFPLKQHKLGELFKNRKETNYCDLELLSVCDGLGIVPRSQLNAKDNSNEDKSKYLKVCIGDLAYNTMRMWQGRCGVSSYEGIVSPAYTVCIPKNDIDVDYMYYLFKTPHMIHDFWRYSQGIVDDTLNLKFNNFEVIKVWIPDKETQTKIAKLLKSYDKEIQILNSKLEKLKDQKKCLMQKLLTGQIRVKV